MTSLFSATKQKYEETIQSEQFKNAVTTSKAAASVGWSKTKEVSAKGYEYSKTKLEPVKQKMDEKGVTSVLDKTAASAKGGAMLLADATKSAYEATNKQIDQNPKLSTYKQSTVQGLSKASSYLIGTWASLTGKNLAPP